MFVLVKDAAESVASSDVEVGDVFWSVICGLPLPKISSVLVGARVGAVGSLDAGHVRWTLAQSVIAAA